MPTVFLSHSSHDKPFVLKLAANLLAEGIPVWLDSWEMDVGDSLQSHIQQGISDSSLFVVTISRKSIESGWVEKEVRLALEHESKIGRKFIFPVRIDDCETPNFIGEWLYADFKSTFSDPLSRLVSTLEKSGARSLLPDVHQEVLCLSFTKQTHLDQNLFFKNLESLQRRHPGHSVSIDQIKVIDDPDYIALKKRLHARIDSIESDKWWTPDFERALKSTPARVREEEEIMIKGVVHIINSSLGLLELREALHWFLNFTRSRLCYELYRRQYPDSSALIYGKDYGLIYGLYGTGEIAHFYGVENTFRVDTWSTKYYPESEIVYIGTEQLRDEELRIRGSIPYANGLENFCFDDAFSRYVLPQVLYRRLSRGTYQEIWCKEDTIIGPR
jgi:TIR domain